MKRILFVSITFFVLTASVSYAQMEATPGEVSVYAGLSSPSGDFSDDVGDLNDGNGYATLGFTLAGTYNYPIGPPELGWISTISLIINRFDGEEAYEVSDSDVDLSSGFWLNIPLMTGLKYQTEASQTLDVYGLGQLGVNLNRGPSTTIEDNSGNSVEISYGTATSFGLNLGTGVVINDKYNIGLRYKKLGEPELEVEVESGDLSDESSYDQSISMIQILVGVTNL